MNTKIAEVFETTDYSKFRRIEGNRDVLDARVKKIMKSFKENGQILNPILVDANYGIIDGQGRFEVCKALGLPIQYIKSTSYNLASCVVLNRSNTNWKLSDYINSFVEQGSTDYAYLKALNDQYGGLGTSVVLNAIYPEKFTANGSDIISGNIKCSPESFNAAVKKLEYEKLFVDTISRSGGNKSFFLMAVGFAYDCPDIDNKLLRNKITNALFMKSGSVDGYINQLETMYNKGLRKDKNVFLMEHFKRFIATRKAGGSHDMQAHRDSRRNEKAEKWLRAAKS